jgi:hypothetical protein
MKLYFENKKASVFTENNKQDDLVKIEVRHKDENETVEEYYFDKEILICAKHKKYTTPCGTKATNVLLTCGIPQERLLTKLDEIVNMLKS